MQQVDQRSERRVLRADRSGPLPQFDLQAWESVDPDRTLERLPRLSIESAPMLPDVLPPPRRTPPASREPELDPQDMASTVEIIPEIALADIMDDSEPELADAHSEPPPLVLPPRASVPFDLDRLLALARAEASKSPEFFQAVAPPPSSSEPLLLEQMRVLPTDVFVVPSARQLVDGPVAGRTEPTMLLSAVVDRRTRRTGWIVGTVVAVAAVTLGIVAGQSGVSSARSPQSVVVTHPSVASPSVATKPAAPPAAATTELDQAAAIPAVSVQNLPVAEVGTISLAAVAATHRLFVDGKLAETGSAVVSCGNHVVQVGSRGARRTVNVPCGQEVVLAR